jgi:hypothetical protein
MLFKLPLAGKDKYGKKDDPDKKVHFANYQYSNGTIFVCRILIILISSADT